jgi:beta-galactosidase
MNTPLFRRLSLATVMFALLVPCLRSTPPTAPAGIPPLMLGSAWYPEQWPEARWDADLELMQKAGFTMVRLGEFAWSSLEPEEGRFELDWMERAIAAAAKRGMVTVIGTPSDAPPAWLSSKYPEILRVAESGQRLEHGSRRQFSYTSAKYRELCRRVVGEMARRFGKHPAVVAWQIDNEYTEDSFDAESRALFHRWLKDRYGSLEKLNAQWMTAYWSQTYSAWEQVPMNTARNNPGLLLDYKRFVTDQWRAFQANQLTELRRHIEPRQLVTTNLGGLGWANRFNRRVIAGDLDLISWDPYVGQGHFDPYRIGATHDLVRGWKQKNFWVLEMQPGFVDWAPISNSLDKGETRAMMWNAVGHGADCVAFWQWRAGLNGQEQYHGVLVGPDGAPVPVYEEIARAGAEFAKAGPVLAGTAPESQVALLHDYDSRWSIDFHKHTQRWDNIDVLLSYYRPLRDLTQSVDIVDPTAPLDRYKLVVAPGLIVMPPELAKRLADYVEGGGHLVLGPRSGMMNGFNALNAERQPGPLAPVLGGRVEQFYALLDDAPVSGTWGSGKATIWAELLSAAVPDTKVLMRYGASNGWLDGQPAVLSRPVGRGRITYLGALFDPVLTRSVAKTLVQEAGVKAPDFRVPEGVEICRRTGAGREVVLLLNFSASAQAFDAPAGLTDVLRGGPAARIELARYGVAILSRQP